MGIRHLCGEAHKKAEFLGRNKFSRFSYTALGRTRSADRVGSHGWVQPRSRNGAANHGSVTFSGSYCLLNLVRAPIWERCRISSVLLVELVQPRYDLYAVVDGHSTLGYLGHIQHCQGV